MLSPSTEPALNPLNCTWLRVTEWQRTVAKQNTNNNTFSTVLFCRGTLTKMLRFPRSKSAPRSFIRKIRHPPVPCAAVISRTFGSLPPVAIWIGLCACVRTACCIPRYPYTCTRRNHRHSNNPHKYHHNGPVTYNN